MSHQIGLRDDRQSPKASLRPIPSCPTATSHAAHATWWVRHLPAAWAEELTKLSQQREIGQSRGWCAGVEWLGTGIGRIDVPPAAVLRGWVVDERREFGRAGGVRVH